MVNMPHCHINNHVRSKPERGARRFAAFFNSLLNNGPCRGIIGYRQPAVLRKRLRERKYEMLFPREQPSLLSIVIPMYNEQEAFPFLKESLLKVKAGLGIPVEIVLIDDGSSDETLRLIYEWARENSDVKVIALSRNFGHQIALTAGLDHAAGDAVVILDADLQDPPELIPEMLASYREGYDVVYGQRISREGETAFKLATANVFYWLMKKFLLPDLPMNAGDFRLISREVLEDLKRIRESDRFMRGLTTWVGYKQKPLFYKRSPRVAGETKYPLVKMIRFAMDAVFSFSDLPMTFMIWFGMFSILVGIYMVGMSFYLHYTGNESLVVGWASLMTAICFFSGAIILSLGTMGKYVGRIYTEAKRRPLYFVRKTVNIEEPDSHD